jgi:DNA polymerase III subunit alpha
VLTSHPGNVPVHLEVARPDGSHEVFRLGDRFRVQRHSGLYGEIKATFGPDAILDEVGDRTFGEDEEPRWRSRA